MDFLWEGASVSSAGRTDFRTFAALILTLVPTMFAHYSVAADVCQLTTARIVSVQGIVEVHRAQTASWKPAKLDTQLCSGDSLRVRKHSRAALRLMNDSLLRLDQRSAITFPETDENNAMSFMDLIKGAIHIITRTPQPFKINTPFLNAGVEGTEFFVGIQSDHTRIVMYEGRVSASNKQGNLMLTDNEAGAAYKDQPPFKETIVQPLDAVQWALYYPAIIGIRHAPPSNPTRTETNTHKQLRDTEYLLSVGQADEANRSIYRLLETDPGNSSALALQSIIAVVQNDKNSALDLATQAVMQNNQSVPAKIALSYAQQAAFKLEDALESIKQAAILDPKNALIWARLSELHMSLGELDEALHAAQEAVNLNPTIAKTQTVLGFAHLLQINTLQAKSIFMDAILLDQAAPMPRLGLGLALIREGKLEAGRIELEIAASLDPGNSLIRSYLGKAYFEEKRYPLAGTQFDLAKKRDPNDPTPWFYDAIQKQTQNRPVEALQNIQKSIELNDNRAVYRSKLLLDQDQAGRGSSLARIYDNLGFEKRAIMETAKSLSHDPASHSAHRFLSDTYANIPRHEAARVSELLQAQLMQPINVNPVQPRMAVADLNIITNTGPASPGFNEFAPLMERNRSQLVTSGFVGNNSTFGNEVVFSKLYERTSVSLGQFHYQSDGFRTNNDQNHDILNAFIQHAVTSKLNVQAEIRTRKTDHGNLLLDFDIDTENPRAAQNRFRRKIDEDAARVGARYSFTPNQNLILSTQYVNRKSKNIDPFGNLRNLETFRQNEGYQAEFQYQLHGNRFNLLAGSGIHRINVKDNKQDRILLFNQVDCCRTADFSNDKTNGYIYTNLNFNPKLNATVGFSYDAYKDKELIINQFNPKLGLQWNIASHLRLRFAWLEGIKAPLTTNQTLEPTQIAGFNQLYDDLNGTRFRRIGIGLDTSFSNKIFSGFEISSRNLHVPNFVGSGSNSVVFEAQKESLYRAYLYGSLHQNWAAKGEVQFEQFSRDPTSVEPHQIDTLSAPISINYFNLQGLFANLTGTFVRHEVNRQGIQNEGVESFFLLDAAIGYRLPNRRGILSLEARNIFNRSFLYRNTNFNTSEPVNARFVPTRTIFARLTFNF